MGERGVQLTLTGRSTPPRPSLFINARNRLSERSESNRGRSNPAAQRMPPSRWPVNAVSEYDSGVWPPAVYQLHAPVFETFGE